MKTLRRYIFAREAEFKKIKPQALKCDYHRVSWETITITELKKRAVWQTLSGADIGNDPMFSIRELRGIETSYQDFLKMAMDEDEKFARIYIQYLRNSKRLYNPRWEYWSWQFDDNLIMIRWAETQAWAPMGIITLERDC
jgi:hypothetical protein